MGVQWGGWLDTSKEAFVWHPGYLYLYAKKTRDLPATPDDSLKRDKYKIINAFYVFVGFFCSIGSASGNMGSKLSALNKKRDLESTVDCLTKTPA